ncbi:MAG: winged helix-turn-helix transcriptional regulator [Nitrososphaerota archaeon]|nr:winged helix-turn-helix transcriptional regulator [Nitrososphaerota archaeon]
MSEAKLNLNVIVNYGDLRVEFSGDPEIVLRSINEFLAKQIPSLTLAKKIMVNYSLNDLINMFSEFIKITPEGARVWKGERELSDRDLITLQLIAAKIGYEIGQSKDPSLSLAEIQASTNLNPKSISSRLSELVKMGYVARESTEQGVRYKITTQGIHWMNNVISKKSRAT